MKKPNIQFLSDLAKAAGQILLDGYGKKHLVEFKGEIDLVTEVDFQAEKMILAEIRKEYPEHKIISEEDGITNLNGRASWYVDPIDGTVNYAQDIPFFCVSIAFGFGTEIELGVVYDPVRGEMFTAEAGKGSWLNGEILQVSEKEDLSKSLLATGFSYEVCNQKNNNLKNYADLALTTMGVRRFGSAALELCYTAAGRFDGVWEQTLGPWDVAAGQLIAAEAGAKVTGKDGLSDCLQPPVSIIAANPVLHEQIAAVLTRNAAVLGWD